MIVSLQNADIKSAINAHVASMGINTTGKEVSVAFKVGRKGSGVTAQVSIHDVGSPSGLFANKAAVKGKGNPSDAPIAVTPVTAAETVGQVDTTVNPAPITEVALADGGVEVQVEAEQAAEPQPEGATDESAPTNTTSLFA